VRIPTPELANLSVYLVSHRKSENKTFLGRSRCLFPISACFSSYRYEQVCMPGNVLNWKQWNIRRWYSSKSLLGYNLKLSLKKNKSIKMWIHSHLLCFKKQMRTFDQSWRHETLYKTRYLVKFNFKTDTFSFQLTFQIPIHKL